MHFVGKILVVLLFVLSIFFMAFAGVVYNAQMNWRVEAQKQKAAVDKVTRDLNDTRQQMEAEKTAMDQKVKTAEGIAQGLDAANRGLQTDLERLKKEVNDYAIARKTSGEQAVIAGEEAVARVEESQNLRKINHDQTDQLNANFEEKTKLEDKLHTLEQQIELAKAKQKDSLFQISVLKQALEANGISADVNELAARSSPPPAVDGIIEQVKPAARLGASELVEISLGSDMGLKKGHELTVYRSGLKGGQRAKFLAKIVIVDTEPHRAVGQVLESSRNGVIQKGDNVTTKL
jgi:chromosome segregation ATPase